MASILLLQNDPLVGEGLSKALAAEPGLQVAGVAGGLAQARRRLEQGGIELLIADLRVGNERLVDLLRERPLRAGELAAATGLRPPAMSRHLRTLRQSGLKIEGWA